MRQPTMSFRLLLLPVVLASGWLEIKAQQTVVSPNQQSDNAGRTSAGRALLPLPKHNFPALVLPAPGYNPLRSPLPMALPLPLPLAGDPLLLLQTAIHKRLGLPYRFYGADDAGYDCSGFVWRVFQDAGADFQRVAARTLWAQLPEAAGAEAMQFGTLVFFNGLKHVGIVRDATSFYHASSSRGVTRSNFAGYWESRITGFRRAPLALLTPLLNVPAPELLPQP